MIVLACMRRKLIVYGRPLIPTAFSLCHDGPVMCIEARLLASATHRVASVMLVFFHVGTTRSHHGEFSCQLDIK